MFERGYKAKNKNHKMNTEYHSISFDNTKTKTNPVL